MKNIVLTGFMGTGKTAVGKKLADRLSMEFIDIDKEIEKLLNMQIKDVFRKYGEKRFRSEEHLMVTKVSKMQGVVISTGGGVVLNAKNMTALRESGVVVNLFANPEVIYKRISKNTLRPLVKGISLEELENKMNERASFYEDADLMIDTSAIGPNGTVNEIVNRLESISWRKNNDE